jgi:hypothetical protein
MIAYQQVGGVEFLVRLAQENSKTFVPLLIKAMPPEPKVPQEGGIDMVLQWVRDGLTSCSEIAEEMGLSKGAVSKKATKLPELGRLKTNGRQYALP